MSEWLSLGEAAALLGVHPGTLRRWSDVGRIVSVRTEGGHRRFERATLQQYLAAQQPTAPDAATEAVLSSPWRHTFTGDSLEEVRHLGQRLLGLLLQFLTRQSEDERFLTESRHIGRTYGDESARAGLAMLDMVEAFLFFRSQFTEMTIQLPAFPRAGDDTEMRRLHGRIDRFMNEVLLGTIEGYEQHTERRP